MYTWLVLTSDEYICDIYEPWLVLTSDMTHHAQCLAHMTHIGGGGNT